VQLEQQMKTVSLLFFKVFPFLICCSASNSARPNKTDKKNSIKPRILKKPTGLGFLKTGFSQPFVRIKFLRISLAELNHETKVTRNFSLSIKGLINITRTPGKCKNKMQQKCHIPKL